MKRLLGMGMLLALMLVHGAPAEAHIKKFRASITANEASDGGNYVNYTITTKAKCIAAGRSIRVLDNTGAVISDPTATTTSASSKIGALITLGQSYRVQITKKVIKKKPGHKHICKGATSAPIIATL